MHKMQDLYLAKDQLWTLLNILCIITSPSNFKRYLLNFNLTVLIAFSSSLFTRKWLIYQMAVVQNSQFLLSLKNLKESHFLHSIEW